MNFTKPNHVQNNIYDFTMESIDGEQMQYLISKEKQFSW